ncbi:MAG: ABC transporter permease subunit [Candidatus Vogelbacteria bacterium]|nr:ABC transporter permease subunit [Candidatus Vogelbacteria bacterium]
MPTILIILAIVTSSLLGVAQLTLFSVKFNDLFLALGSTMARLASAYCLSVVIALPLAFIIYFSPTAERFLLPLYDIVESVPTLAFFPAIVIFFVKYNFVNGAAIFIIFLSMLWNIVFTVVGGLTGIPNDVKAAAHVFRVKGLSEIRYLLLPAIVPQLVTGSILAWAQGWNIIIVAEVLHTYLPAGIVGGDLFGIGSMLVNASSSGQGNIFFAAIVAMIVTIAFLNFFVWQKLLQYAEHYKFD